MKRVTPRRGKPGKAPAPIDDAAIEAGLDAAAQVVEHRQEALQAPVLPGLDLPEELPTHQPPPDRAL